MARTTVPAEMPAITARGDEVHVAVPSNDDADLFKRLKDKQPYDGSRAYSAVDAGRTSGTTLVHSCRPVVSSAAAPPHPSGYR